MLHVVKIRASSLRRSRRHAFNCRRKRSHACLRATAVRNLRVARQLEGKMEALGHSERWLQEAHFCDAKAATRADRPEPIDPTIVERYKSSGRLFSKEYCC